MTEIVVQQNTPEWKALRRGPTGFRIGASEAAAACGFSRWTSRTELWQKIMNEKNGVPSTFQTTAAMQWGHDNERRAAMLYHWLWDGEVMLLPGNYWTKPGADDEFGCSPDRVVVSRADATTRWLLEIKTPYSTRPRDIYPDYMAQIQYQMWITGAQFVDFFSVFYDAKADREHGQFLDIKHPHEAILFRRVPFSPEYFSYLEPYLQEFASCLRTNTPPSQGMLRPPPAAVLADTLPQPSQQPWWSKRMADIEVFAYIP